MLYLNGGMKELRLFSQIAEETLIYI